MPNKLEEVAAVLVVEKGGQLNAAGTATNPITFTAFNADSYDARMVTTDSGSDERQVVKGNRGKWGGLILLGNAPTTEPTTNTIEGLTDAQGAYGGTVADDNSGTLKYVRVWHGGAVIGADNEINGITFGGVGSNTIVEHCEVAFNVDDGFEWFGGTVNGKWLSVLFVGDDAFDTDEGFQGKVQYAFVMTGLQGNHGTEMDSKYDKMPRSHPQFYSMTILGGGVDATGDNGKGTGSSKRGLMRLTEGTGGKFGNTVLAYANKVGLYNHKCSDSTSTAPASVQTGLSTYPNRDTIGTGAQGTTSNDGYLYFSNKNVVHVISGGTDAANIDNSDSGCGTFTAQTGFVPSFKGVSASCLDYACLTNTFDPLPVNGGAGTVCGTAYTEAPYETAGASHFTAGAPTCSGAFPTDSDNWMSAYSWLACSNKMAIPSTDTRCSIPTSPFATLTTATRGEIERFNSASSVADPSVLASDVTANALTTYILDRQRQVALGPLRRR
jgi:hypothetical protein